MANQAKAVRVLRELHLWKKTIKHYSVPHFIAVKVCGEKLLLNKGILISGRSQVEFLVQIGLRKAVVLATRKVMEVCLYMGQLQ